MASVDLEGAHALTRAEGGHTAAIASTAALLSILIATSAAAQTVTAEAAQTAPAGPESGPVQEVVVTGTHIQRDGFSAPTPTTMMSSDDIQRAALPNIADFVNQLPALSSTMTPTVNNGMTSSGNTGQNFLNLRGLGINRTLVLLDGRRVVPTATTGATDVNNIPSQLIKRIDVVTGGASAAYGSDAVAGVVNFVLDTGFTGFKAEAEGGLSSRGDDRQTSLSLSYGAAALDGRLHLLFSAMGSDTPGIRFLDRGSRNWDTGVRLLPNPAYVSQQATPNIPALATYNEVNNALAAPGGLITSGPARGTQFGVGGQPLPFQYGSPVIGTFMVGGQYGDDADETTFVAAVRNANLFSRASFDVSDDTTAYVQLNYGYSRGMGYGAPQRHFGNISIKNDNAYLPAAIRDSVCGGGAPANATCFSFGTDGADLGGGYDPATNMVLGGGLNIDTRRTYIATAGMNGKLFGTWKWDVYYQYGQSDVELRLENDQITANFNRAVDAVFDSHGNIVCRSTLTDPNNGCVPLNLFGIGVASQQARDYVQGVADQQDQLVQQVAEGTLRGDLFKLWAGPLSAAIGAGYRRENTSSPYTDPLALANAYFAANYKPTTGSYDVKEVFGEALLPLARETLLLRALDLDAAVRFTDYSTSGSVTTYKLGLNYRPVEDVLIRGNLSRDIRAPNLSELYSGGTTSLSPVTDPLHGNTAGSVPSATVGNLQLTPETAKSYGIGIVYQPSWVRGLNMSVDYYHIDLSDAIANIGVQQEVNLCASGTRPDICSLITRGPGVVGGVAVDDALLHVTSSPINIASVKTSGLDVELAYRARLSDWIPAWNASMTLRMLGSHVAEYISNDGLGNVHDSAGENGGALPDWRFLTSLDYQQGPVDLGLTWRRISSGVWSTTFFDNSAGPLTVDNNRISGADYLDLSTSFTPQALGGSTEFFLAITNVLDKDPPVAAVAASFLYTQYNPELYDGVGRYFHAGVRLRF